MRKIAFTLGLALAFAAGQVMAQAQRNEMSFFGQFANMSSGGTDVKLSLAGFNYGYYFMPQLVGKVGVVYIQADAGGGNSAKSTDLELGAKYYFGGFRRGAFVPFAEGYVGTSKIDAGGTSESNSRFRIGVGGSYFINETTSIDPTLSYVTISTSPDKTTGYILGIQLTTRF